MQTVGRAAEQDLHSAFAVLLQQGLEPLVPQPSGHGLTGGEGLGKMEQLGGGSIDEDEAVVLVEHDHRRGGAVSNSSDSLVLLSAQLVEPDSAHDAGNLVGEGEYEALADRIRRLTHEEHEEALANAACDERDGDGGLGALHEAGHHRMRWRLDPQIGAGDEVTEGRVA